MTAQDRTFLEKIKSTVNSVEPNAEVILFGSRARGDFHAESDWDILILSNKQKIFFEDERIFRKALFQLELEYSEPISILIYGKEDWKGRLSVVPLHQSIEQEGIVL